MKNNEKLEVERNGQFLGGSVQDHWNTTEIMPDHIENETEKAMKFDFGLVPKSLIAGLIWHTQKINGQMISTVCRVVVPQWFAIKEGF